MPKTIRESIFSPPPQRGSLSSLKFTKIFFLQGERFRSNRRTSFSALTWLQKLCYDTGQ